MIVPGLDQSELAHLKELQETHETVSSPGWKARILPLLESEVENAHEAMVGNLSNDPMTYMRLQLRWQQREAMLRAVLAYVQDCEEQRTRILEEIEQRRKEAETTEPEVAFPLEDQYA